MIRLKLVPQHGRFMPVVLKIFLILFAVCGYNRARLFPPGGSYMSISRRELLRHGSLLSAVAAVSALIPSKLRAAAFTGAPSGASTAGLPPESDFTALLGTSFEVVNDETNTASPVWLTLTKVKTIESPAKSASVCKGFVLQFWGGSYDELPQSTYTITSGANKKLPPFKLVLVPSVRKSRAYHAVIYNLVS
jgi:hypothetical protein